MDASANLVSLDICVMNRCVPQHASKDMANASLDFQAPSPTQFANVNLDGRALIVATALYTLAVQLHLPLMVHALNPTNAVALRLVHPTLSVTSTKKVIEVQDVNMVLQPPTTSLI